MRRSQILAWLLAGLIVALTVAAAVMMPDEGKYADAAGEGEFFAAMLATSTVVGLLIAQKRPGNRIGWLLLLNALLLSLAGLADGWASQAAADPGSLPGGRVAAIWDTSGWPLLFAGLIALAFVFPDGKLPSPRWRFVVPLAVVSFTLELAGGLLSGDRLDAPFDRVPPPAVLPDSVSAPMQMLGLVGMCVTFVLAMAALVVRFRRAEGEERQQMKWIAYAGISIPLAIGLGIADPDPDSTGPATFLGLLLVMVSVPAAIGVAVLRYRLYDIDRLISATLVYGVLTVTLGAVFAAVVLVLGVALGGDSAVATAVATLGVTLAFRPLRRRVQTVVDRRFDRARYEGRTRVDDFLADLREDRARPEAVGEVLGAAVGDPALRLFFWLPSAGSHADERGQVLELPGEPPERTPVRRGGLLLGTVVHNPAPQLLDELILRAGLAIEIARLRVEVRGQLAEVEASRTRIVSATYEERRRLERDLHDGAQQRLVSIGLELRHVQHELGPGSDSALDSAVTGLSEAIDELRELARGVRPAALDDGLAPALEELAARAPIDTEVRATDERFAEEIEAAAYFVASEAMANAVKHAEGSRVVVSADRVNGRLVLRVEDDGHGGAARGTGSGLTGLEDRVSALGGRLDLSSDGAGTRLVAELPCG